MNKYVKEHVFLYGASGHAKVIIDILEAQGKNVSGFIDDNQSLNNFRGLRVYHDAKDIRPILISIGDNKTRKIVADKLTETSFEIAIHPSAIISQRSYIGYGTVVAQGAVIQADTVVGKHCIINTGATLDHDCKIQDFVHISPNATLCGNVNIGEGSWIGAGVTIIPGVKIGNWSRIGAGAVVLKDVSDNAVVAGVPAKLLKYKSIDENEK